MSILAELIFFAALLFGFGTPPSVQKRVLVLALVAIALSLLGRY